MKIQVYVVSHSEEDIQDIDYDLDAKLFPDNTIKVLDEKEYLRNKEHYKYSEELDEVLRYQMNDILKRMENREFPFVDERVHSYYDKYLKLTEKAK